MATRWVNLVCPFLWISSSGCWGCWGLMLNFIPGTCWGLSSIGSWRLMKRSRPAAPNSRMDENMQASRIVPSRGVIRGTLRGHLLGVKGTFFPHYPHQTSIRLGSGTASALQATGSSSPAGFSAAGESSLRSSWEARRISAPVRARLRLFPGVVQGAGSGRSA